MWRLEEWSSVWNEREGERALDAMAIERVWRGYGVALLLRLCVCGAPG